MPCTSCQTSPASAGSDGGVKFMLIYNQDYVTRPNPFEGHCLFECVAKKSHFSNVLLDSEMMICFVCVLLQLVSVMTSAEEAFSLVKLAFCLLISRYINYLTVTQRISVKFGRNSGLGQRGS